MKFRYTVFSTAFGWCGIVRGEKGLVRILLPEQDKGSIAAQVRSLYPGATPSDTAFEREIAALNSYCAGKPPNFSFMLDFSGATPFQRKVWQETKKIPYGEARTYAWLAQQIQAAKAMRAVGNALAKNPFPIVVPCHRVIRSDGKLGKFSSPRGSELKRALLQLEAAIV